MKFDWILHNKLYRNIRLNVTYVNKSPLRIGTTKGKSLTSSINLIVSKINIDNKELPYIPGSSLKGVFRSTAENILKSYNIHICDKGDEPKDLTNELNNKNNNIDEIRKILDNYCICCKIFGSSSYASHIVFSDAYAANSFTFGIKTEVAINRRSGSVKRNVLYEVEYVNPGVSFEGEIVMKNTPNYAIGLVVKVIDFINAGIIKIGGFKSKGFGEIECNIKSIDGTINVNGDIKRLEEINILSKLDDKDNDIHIDKDNPLKILDQAKEIFNEYTNR
jgi:CRISPR-associated RAMP protein (TIGR02581 family)